MDIATALSFCDLIGNTAVGVSKYRSFNVDLDGNNLGSASGWGFDLGLLAPLPYGLRLRWSLKTWAALTYSMKTGYPRRCMIRAIAWACPTVPLRASRSAWTWTIVSSGRRILAARSVSPARGNGDRV